jgi:hypothetical protein
MTRRGGDGETRRCGTVERWKGGKNDKERGRQGDVERWNSSIDCL